MNKLYRKIIPLLIIILLLPTIILSLYQISSLNQSEKNIEKIYSNELTTILSSINEFIVVYVSDWARSVNLLVVETKNSHAKNFFDNTKKILRQNHPILLLMLADTSLSHQPVVISNYQDSVTTKFQNIVKDLLVINENKVKILFAQNRIGIRKLETISDSELDNNILIIFLLELPKGKSEVCGLLINPEYFIRQILSTKVKAVTQNEFLISISNERNNRVVFSTGKNFSTAVEKQVQLTLLPGFSISIMLKGPTISSIVRERSIKNLILIFLINLFLLIGLWLVRRNFRKETELAKQQSDFVSNVSHELRTPLSLINLFSETLILGRVKDREKEKEYFKIINEESNRLSRIVDKILHFYAIDEKKRKYNFMSENLNLIVKNILQTYGYQIENNKFKVIFEPGNNLPNIQADKEAVVEVVINLLDNAMKYSKDKKEIAIETGAGKDFVYLKIQDYGTGISAVNQKKIFDKFFRVQNGLAHDTKGTGLGLTIVKSIMDAHQGKIKIESSEGKGSCFTLMFKQNNA
ncbi:MAG: sensor histidine kinase [Ignavibacteriaceae bacterium]